MQLRIISEAGYGRTYSFDYQNANTDKRPRLLLLGKWRHPTTRNILLAGINLNYLDDAQLAEVRKNLKQIITPRNLKSRYWKGKQLLPDVFENAYRTYDKDYVGSITKDTLKFWPSDEALEKAEKQAQDAEAKKKEAEAKKLAVPGALGAAAPTPAPAPGVPPAAGAPEPTTAAPAAPKVPAAPEPGAEPAPKPEATPKGALPGPKAPAAPAPSTPRQRRLAKTPKVAAPKPAAPAVAPTEPVTAPEAKPIQPAEAEPKTKASSAQKRKKQAEQIEKAIQRTEPQPKPEPPPEIGGAINMFKGPSPK